MTRQHTNRWLFILMIVGALLVGCATPAATDHPEMAATEAPMEAPESESVDITVMEYDGEDQTDAQTVIEPQQQDRMIVKNGSLSISVADPEAAVNAVGRIAAAHDGYVLTSDVSGGDEMMNATVTIAVRSDQFELAMEDLRGVADEVLRESASGEDVTGEYVDLGSRLRTLELTRERIQGFLDQAQTVEEALEVSRELTSIDAEIEQVRGRMQYLSGRSAYSTITVMIQSIQPEPQEEAAASASFSAIETLSQALGTQVVIFQGLLQLVIWLLVVPGPYLIAGGLIFAGVRMRLKRHIP